MTRGRLQQILVTVPRRLEPAFQTQLRTLAGQWPTSWIPMDDDRAEISLFLPARRGTTRLLRALRAYRDVLRRLALPVGPIRIQRRFIRSRDWARAWRNSFEPVEISPTLVVKPTWAKWLRRDSQTVIEIDPTLAFGTGHHPTTAFCLRMVERLARRRHPARGDKPLAFLDCGCGSGILTIAAARLGCAPAVGFDIDRQAVRVARANAKLNGVHERTEIICSALERFRPRGASRPPGKGRFDLVAANLASDVLVSNARRLTRWVRPGGVLALAGVLDRDARKVAAVFRRLGWRRIARESCGGWTSWAMKRTP
ncbi:MAG: 50S ribosomal protein L11 methyltransferase [Verrucomicrobiae bacterium]|nr:50S ribosomal protein L11 methyltransferase [Verrucomicrobiae bacterium]